MVVRTEPSHLRSGVALALGLVLALGGCSSDEGADDVTDEQTEPAQDEDPAEEEEEAADEPGDDTEEPADDTEEEQAAAADDSGECPLDAGSVSEVVAIGFEITLDDVNELANDGVSCIYKGETDDVAVIAAVSLGTWDGSDERVQQVVDQTAEYFDEPVATPGLGDQAFLFDDDFGGTSLIVFVDGEQYSTALSGAGWTGTSLESLDERQAILVELYERATG
ncbi:MAG: hypothetical protein U5L04_11380 [Trueperaceae bacterium]|nr:hypothetical protein [Trueperaceae bacterium]